jgi:DNA modification methylase
MERFGDLGGIVFNVRTGHLVGGHQRIKELDPAWRIMKRPHHDKVGTVSLGYIRTPFGLFQYREVDWGEDTELAANLAANKISGEWDNVKLAPILEDLMKNPDLFNVTGFTAQEANLITESIKQAERDLSEDEAPPLPVKPTTRPGQLWRLGPHRLLCGDATKPESWLKLLGKEKAALCITDFPYGESYNVHNKSEYDRILKRRVPNREREDIVGDESTQVAKNVLPLIFQHLIDDGVAYFTCGTDLAVDLIAWLREARIHYGTLMVWHKHFPVVSWNRYHAEHELIVFAGKGSRPGKFTRWFGPKDESTVWDIPLDAHGERVHPTQKPVALYERAMVNSSAPGEMVVDPCAGSGPCLVAAEKHGRKAYLMEINPGYCDVILHRYISFTGRKPT